MRIVRESLYEKFEKESDPIKDMGIGTPIEGEMINRIIELNKKYNGLGYKHRNTKNTFFVFWQVNENVKVRISYYKNFLEKFNRYHFGVWIYLDEKVLIIFGRSYLEETFSYLEERLKDRNFIFESFKKESDPIKDMGIGIEEKIKRDFEEQKRLPYIYTKELAFTWAIKSNNIEYVKDLIELGVDVTCNNNYALSHAAFYNKYELVKILLEAGALVDFDAVHFAKETLTNIPNHEILELLKKYAIKQGADLKKLQLNEKFEEESDPIRDMGIGIEYVRSFNTLEEAAKFIVDNIKILSKGMFTSTKDLYDYVYNSSNYYQTRKSLLKFLKEYLEGYNRKFVPLTIKELGNRFDKNGAKLHFIRVLRDAIHRELNDEDRELNEKFEEESDPISDMGIGGYSFETLKPGAILRAKRFFGLSNAGRLGGVRCANNIWSDTYLLVADIFPGDKPGTKCIQFYRSRDYKKLKEYKEKRLKKDGETPWVWAAGMAYGKFHDISKRQFDYRLEVIENGFK